TSSRSMRPSRFTGARRSRRLSIRRWIDRPGNLLERHRGRHTRVLDGDLMTITAAHTATRTTALPDGAHLLIAPLREAIAACAELDPDLLHSTTELGPTVVPLA